MRAYDPIPDFNCNDPTPAPIPRKPSWIGRALIASLGIAGAALGTLFMQIWGVR